MSDYVSIYDAACDYVYERVFVRFPDFNRVARGVSQGLAQAMQRLKQHGPLGHAAGLQQVFQMGDVTNRIGVIRFDGHHPGGVINQRRRIRKAGAPTGSFHGRPSAIAPMACAGGSTVESL